MKIDIADYKQDNNLSNEELQVLWKLKAKSLGEKGSITYYAKQWLLYVHNYLEFFFLDHLNLSKEDCIDFGYQNDLETAMRTISASVIQESLIFIAANYTMSFDENLMEDAYTSSIQLYGKYSKETPSIKNKTISKYRHHFKKEGKQIHLIFSDKVIATRMIGIGMNFSFTNKEFEYIQNALGSDLGSSIVVQIENNYNYSDKDTND